MKAHKRERIEVDERKERGRKGELAIFISNWEYQAILQVCFDYP